MHNSVSDMTIEAARKINAESDGCDWSTSGAVGPVQDQK